MWSYYNGRHELWFLPNAALVISLLGENSEYNRLRNLVIAWLVLSAVTDVLVSGTLIHFLVGLSARESSRIFYRCVFDSGTEKLEFL